MNQVNTSGLVAWCKLDHSAFDYSLNGNNGVATGTNIATSYPGYLFNGTDDKITIADGVSFDFSTAMSVFSWIKPTALANGDGFISKHTTAGELREWSMLATGVSSGSAKVVIYIGAVGGATVTTETTDDLVISNGTWAHIGFTYNAGVVKIYIDGVLVDSTTSGTHVTSLNNEAVDIKVGVHEANYHNGVIGDVRIYDTIKSAAEAKNIYEQTRGGY